jgi:hypothetical protein
VRSGVLGLFGGFVVFDVFDVVEEGVKVREGVEEGVMGAKFFVGGGGVGRDRFEAVGFARAFELVADAQKRSGIVVLDGIAEVGRLLGEAGDELGDEGLHQRVVGVDATVRDGDGHGSELRWGVAIEWAMK